MIVRRKNVRFVGESFGFLGSFLFCFCCFVSMDARQLRQRKWRSQSLGKDPEAFMPWKKCLFHVPPGLNSIDGWITTKLNSQAHKRLKIPIESWNINWEEVGLETWDGDIWTSFRFFWASLPSSNILLPLLEEVSSPLRAESLINSPEVLQKCWSWATHLLCF